MAVKTSFEPKDARVTFDRKYFSNDIPRKQITGTQALVEFLNTTSPEEFKKATVPTKRSSSALFFKRGLNSNNKTKATMPRNSTPITTPTLIHRKNYIEIIANPFTFNRSKETSQEAATVHHAATPSLSSIAVKPTKESKKLNHIAILGSQLDHTLSNPSTANIYSTNNPAAVNKPLLPMRKSNHGLFTVTSPTMISAAATTSSSERLAARSKVTTNRRQIPSLRIASAIQQDDQYIHSIQSTPKSSFNKDEEDDLVEKGLRQRLNHYQSILQEKPSDAVSKRLVHEHMVALQVASSMMIDEGTTRETTRRKKKKATRCRHIQVQTMVPYPDDSLVITHQQQIEEKEKQSPAAQQAENIDELKQRLERVEKELKQEKLVSSRLQAALEETRDQCEVLSGLAYKKLREVWEEKTRWENACIETKERCWHDHQQQILGRHATHSASTTHEEEKEEEEEEGEDGMMDFMVDQDIELQSEGEEEDLI